jgi:hypothetical protein
VVGVVGLSSGGLVDRRNRVFFEVAQMASRGAYYRPCAIHTGSHDHVCPASSLQQQLSAVDQAKRRYPSFAVGGISAPAKTPDVSV